MQSERDLTCRHKMTPWKNSNLKESYQSAIGCRPTKFYSQFVNFFSSQGMQQKPSRSHWKSCQHTWGDILKRICTGMSYLDLKLIFVQSGCYSILQWISFCELIFICSYCCFLKSCYSHLLIDLSLLVQQENLQPRD